MDYLALLAQKLHEFAFGNQALQQAASQGATAPQNSNVNQVSQQQSANLRSLAEENAKRKLLQDALRAKQLPLGSTK